MTKKELIFLALFPYLFRPQNDICGKLFFRCHLTKWKKKW